MYAKPTCPLIYIWPDRRLYLGSHPVPLREYNTASDQLVIALEGTFKVQAPGEPFLETRSFLVRAGTQVLMDMIDTSNTVVAICFFDPIGQDYAVNKQLMKLNFEEYGSHADHCNEQMIVDGFLHLRDNKLSATEAYQFLDDLLIPADMKHREIVKFDPRIIKVVHRIRETVKENIPVSQLAEEVFLSESRLLKLFKSQIGIPIRRYRLRHRLFVGVMHLAAGASVTDAAIEAGFSSSAHFSKSHSAMFGIQPSTALLKPPFADVIIPDEYKMY